MQDVMGIPVVADPTLPPDEVRILSREEQWLPPRFEHEEKTVWLFGKPYYWATKGGRYHLLKGHSPRDLMTQEGVL